jgi:hypothetical protein
MSTKTGTGNTVFSDSASILSPTFVAPVGTTPFTVVSNTLVNNLNSDLLDGQHGTYYTGFTSTAYTQANNAFDKANTGVAISTAAFAQANTGIKISDDSTTDYDYNLLLANVSSGTLATANTSSTNLYFNPNTGTLNSTTFNSLSDESVKTDVTQITNSLNVINNISGVEFIWKSNKNKSAGVIAQQLESILPFLVNTNNTGLKSVNYSGIIAYLIEAIKELTNRIDELEKK